MHAHTYKCMKTLLFLGAELLSKQRVLKHVLERSDEPTPADAISMCDVHAVQSDLVVVLTNGTRLRYKVAPNSVAQRDAVSTHTHTLNKQFDRKINVELWRAIHNQNSSPEK